ncbi:MAG: GMC family oxidoreductase [Alphaproteobacteria bacterium]|nr:GMC family oxidoreductase [Alphaproteobacteria bacterium]
MAAKSHREFEPDVVIVGSGAGGGMAAYVLTRAGIKTLVLEAGRDYDPMSDSAMLKWNHEAPLRAAPTPEKDFGYYDATVNGGWSVPGEPYTSAPGSVFRWWRSRMLGGRTNHWGRHSPRFGPYDFKPFSRDGLGMDWPISYADMAPWYDRTEKLVGVIGTNVGLENHPDSSPGVLLPSPKPRATELMIQAAANDLGIPCVPSRYAVLSRAIDHPHAPREACFNASPCGRGCGIGAAFQTTTSLLPMAMGTGKLRITTNATVARVLTDARGKARGVEYFDKDGVSHFIKARVVVLAASACDTAKILLNSKDGGLANSSGEVGKNLLDTTGTNIAGHIPALEGRPRYNEDGMDVAHLYIPFWLYKEQAAGKLDFPRGYHYEIGGRFNMPGAGLPLGGMEDGYGLSLKEDARRYYGAQLSYTVRGEMIPNKDSYCELDPVVKDKVGMPVLRFHWKWSQHEIRQIAHGIKTAREMIQRLGGTVTTPDLPPEKAIADGGFIIHELGTTRMGDKASNSVTDSFGKSWDIDNLVIADGSVFTSNAHKNPTLTILALSMRNSAHLAQRMKKGEL